MASKPEMCLRWHSYENSLLMSVSDMWDAGVMTDITLSAEGRTIHAHQVVLSSSSDYFKEILQDITPAQHPIVVLPFACFADLHVAVQFMYKGEVNLTEAELPGLLRMAEVLRVKGLARLNPSMACGLLRKAYQNQKPDETDEIPTAKIPDIKVEPDVWNTANSSLSYGEDEEAVEVTEIADLDNESSLPMEEEQDCDEEQSNCGNSDRDGLDSGSEQSEGKLYFLTSLGQHEEQHSSSEKKTKKGLHQTQPSMRKTSTGVKKRSRTKHNRGTKGSSVERGTSRSDGDLLQALSAAWEKERNNGRATIRKTLLPVSCPVCFKVLSNAYNLKVHMSIHDGLNHQCSICGHTSKSRDALRKHLAYRHLIGQSGPVRPRLPADKRRRVKEEDVSFKEEDYDDAEMPPDSGNVSATPTNLSDLDAEILLQCEEADEGVEEVDNSEADHLQGQLNPC